MDYSLNKRKMTIGSMKGKEVYVASPVCQKQRISFDKLCARMAEDTTVGDADVAAVFYKFVFLTPTFALRRQQISAA